jgi:hypothetical protein
VSSVSAHELVRTVLCKVEDCGEPATATRGRYALLCDTHRAEKARAVPLRTVPPLPAPAAAGSASTIKQAAQKLVPAAADLDKALGRRNLARADAVHAFTAFKQALDELHAVAKEAVA